MLGQLKNGMLAIVLGPRMFAPIPTKYFNFNLNRNVFFYISSILCSGLLVLEDSTVNMEILMTNEFHISVF